MNGLVTTDESGIFYYLPGLEDPRWRQALRLQRPRDRRPRSLRRRGRKAKRGVVGKMQDVLDHGDRQEGKKPLNLLRSKSYASLSILTLNLYTSHVSGALMFANKSLKVNIL